MAGLEELLTGHLLADRYRIEEASSTLVSAVLSRPGRTPSVPVVPGPGPRVDRGAAQPPVSAPAPRVEPRPPAPAASQQQPPGRERPTRRAPARRWGRIAAFLLLAVIGIAAAWWLSDGRSGGQTTVETAAVPDADSLQVVDTAAPETLQTAAAAPAPAETSTPLPPAPEQPVGRAPGEQEEREAAPEPASPAEPTAPPPAAPATQPAIRSPASAEPASGIPAPRLNAEGLRALQQGDFSAAVDRFRRATEQSPGSIEYRNNYGWAFFRMGDIQAADREIQQVIRQDPQREIAYANLGEVRLAQGDTAAAIAMYERFLEPNRDPRRRSIAEEKLRSLRQP
jgi:TolA-binding protein